MAKADPTKLAAAILKARGTKGYDALIVSTFEALAKEPELAWEVLELADERGCSTNSMSVGDAYVEREVRVLGRAVAFRDAPVTDYRDLDPPGPVTIAIAKTRAAADKRALAAVQADEAPVIWGTRPLPGDIPDWNAHKAEQERICKAADIAALKAYRERYRDTVVLETMALDGFPRHHCIRVWELTSIIQTAAHESDDPKFLKVLLADKPSKRALEGALGNAINAKHFAVAMLLLPLVEDLNPLLTPAVNSGNEDIVRALLKAGALPTAETPRTPLIDAALKTMPITMETAIMTGNVARVLELLPTGDVDFAIGRSAQEGKTEIVRAVLATKPKTTPELLGDALWSFAQLGDEAGVKLMLAHGADREHVHWFVKTSAIEAAKAEGHAAVVKLLERK